MDTSLEQTALIKTKDAKKNLEKINSILQLSNNSFDLWQTITPKRTPLSKPSFLEPTLPRKPFIDLPQKPLFDDFLSIDVEKYNKPEPSVDDDRFWKKEVEGWVLTIWTVLITAIITLIFLIGG